MLLNLVLLPKSDSDEPHRPRVDVLLLWMVLICGTKICICERLESLNEHQFSQIVDFIKDELNCSVQVPDNFGNHNNRYHCQKEEEEKGVSISSLTF